MNSNNNSFSQSPPHSFSSKDADVLAQYCALVGSLPSSPLPGEKRAHSPPLYQVLKSPMRSLSGNSGPAPNSLLLTVDEEMLMDMICTDEDKPP